LKRRYISVCCADHPWIKEDGEAPDTPLDNVVMNRLKQFTAMNQFKKAALRVRRVFPATTF
jgi:calcium-dependent protein kinase